MQRIVYILVQKYLRLLYIDRGRRTSFNFSLSFIKKLNEEVFDVTKESLLGTPALCRLFDDWFLHFFLLIYFKLSAVAC